MESQDARYMALALRLARRGFGRAWPNPAVGAVLVTEADAPEVLARGWTGEGGRPHAEAVVLQRAAAARADGGGRTEGATLYVSLEPCSHAGRGAPCADAIAEAGVGRVVCALGDPDPRVDGRGLERLRRGGVKVETGLLEAEARWVALGHILRVRERRPFVQLKTAVGADGRMAPGRGRPVWVTGEAARARAHLLRAGADAILVGRGTVEADDPRLDCRLPGLEDRSPVRVVLDSGLRLSPSARLLADADTKPVWLLTTDAAPEGRAVPLARAGATIVRVAADAGGRVEIAAALQALAERGITRLLVEGGPTVAGSLLDAGLVDEAIVFHGVELAGDDGIAPFAGGGLQRVTDSDAFRLHAERCLGPDLLRVYRREG